MENRGPTKDLQLEPNTAGSGGKSSWEEIILYDIHDH